jgi:prevent-host-death family protein
MMRLQEDIKPISYIKSHAADMLNQINQTHRPIIITQNGEVRGVFLDTDSYENMQSALGLMKLIAHAEDHILHHKVASHEQVFSRLEKRFAVAKK